MLRSQQTLQRFDLSKRGSEISSSYLGDLIILFSILFVSGFITSKFAIQASLLGDLNLNHLINGQSGTNFFYQVKWGALVGLASMLVVYLLTRFFAFWYLSWSVVMRNVNALLSTLRYVDLLSSLHRVIKMTISTYVSTAGITFVTGFQRSQGNVSVASWALVVAGSSMIVRGQQGVVDNQQ